MANHNRLPLIGVLLAGVALTVVGARWWSERTERQFQAHLAHASVAELQTMTAKRDWDPQVFYWLGVRQQQAGQYHEAVEALARSASLDSKFAPAKNAFHLALEQDHEAQLRAASIPQLMQVAARNQNDPLVWYWLGAKLTTDGKQKQAVQALSRAVTLNPKSASARAAFGLALARADRPQESEIQLKDAIAIDPKSEFAHFSLGNLYGKHNRWEQAANALQTAVALNPDDKEANYLLAISYGNMYLEDRKQEILERLVQRSPDDVRFLKSLGYVYLYFGKFAQAETT